MPPDRVTSPYGAQTRGAIRLQMTWKKFRETFPDAFSLSDAVPRFVMNDVMFRLVSVKYPTLAEREEGDAMVTLDAIEALVIE